MRENPPALPHPPAPRLRRALGSARAALWVEAAWTAALAWPAGAVGLYLLAAALGLTSSIPGEIRVILVALLAAALVGSIIRAVRRVPAPTPTVVRRRAEAAAGLPLGQLAPLTEPPVPHAGTPAAALWHRASLAAAGARLPLAAPRAFVPRLPAAAFALGIVAAVAALAVAPGRIGAALSPFIKDLSGAEAALLLQPPPYAGADARRLVLRNGDRLRLPALAGTRVRADGYSPDGPWRLIRDGNRWTVRHGSRTFARLALDVTADRPPAVAWAAEPGQAPSGAVKIAFSLADDFDDLSLALEVADGGHVRRIPLAAGLARGAGRAVADLGQEPVESPTLRLTLVVRDAAGQEARSAPRTLPVRPRVFTDPLAREIIAARARLLAAPEARDDSILDLERLAAAAVDAGPPAATFPALRAAAYRLAYDRRYSAVPLTARLLWDAAVARDGGGTGESAKELMAALDALAQALARPGSAQSAAAAAELEALLARYLAAMGEAQARAGEQPGASGGATIDASALLEMARELAEREAAGDREGAQQLLQALRQAVDGLRLAGPGRAPGGQGGPPQPAGYDPLGRPGAGFGGGRVQYLDPARARELEAIRGTLRDRAADPARPPGERDYYRRLIDRF